MAAEVSKDKLLKMYRTMQTIRQFEERLRDRFKEGKVPGFVHVSIGEEASATGVCAAHTDTAHAREARLEAVGQVELEGAEHGGGQCRKQ